MERAFKGVWIPKEIWLSKDLTLQEKVFLVEISSLDNENGCYASNAYFADFFQLSKNRCSEVIKSLEKKNLISVQYIREPGKKSIQKRVLRVIGKQNRGIREVEEPIRDSDRPIRETEEGYSEKCEENNTSFNNTLSNTSNKDNVASAPSLPYSEIIDYLNKKAHTKYKSTSKKTQELIKARFNEGFTLDDFKKVIDKKAEEWLKDSKMSQYVRPVTLFGTKFESYLNQKGGQAGEKAGGHYEGYDFDKQRDLSF